MSSQDSAIPIALTPWAEAFMEHEAGKGRGEYSARPYQNRRGGPAGHLFWTEALSGAPLARTMLAVMADDRLLDPENLAHVQSTTIEGMEAMASVLPRTWHYASALSNLPDLRWRSLLNMLVSVVFAHREAVEPLLGLPWSISTDPQGAVAELQKMNEADTRLRPHGTLRKLRAISLLPEPHRSRIYGIIQAKLRLAPMTIVSVEQGHQIVTRYSRRRRFSRLTLVRKAFAELLLRKGRRLALEVRRDRLRRLVQRFQARRHRRRRGSSQFYSDAHQAVAEKAKENKTQLPPRWENTLMKATARAYTGLNEEEKRYYEEKAKREAARREREERSEALEAESELLEIAAEENAERASRLLISNTKPPTAEMATHLREHWYDSTMCEIREQDAGRGAEVLQNALAEGRARRIIGKASVVCQGGGNTARSAGSDLIWKIASSRDSLQGRLLRVSGSAEPNDDVFLLLYCKLSPRAVVSLLRIRPASADLAAGHYLVRGSRGVGSALDAGDDPSCSLSMEGFYEIIPAQIFRDIRGEQFVRGLSEDKIEVSEPVLHESRLYVLRPETPWVGLRQHLEQAGCSEAAQNRKAKEGRASAKEDVDED